MARFLWSKAKLSRKLGVNLFWLPKISAIMTKRAWKVRSFKKKSEYWLQLQEKQIARHLFWLTEKQFKKYYKIAVKSKHITWDELLRQIEMRADNIIYRAGLAESRPQARQMISHWHFELNWHKITIPSIQLKVWDKLIIRKKLQKSILYTDKKIENATKWLKSDEKVNSVEMLSIPESAELEQFIKTHLIIEFYSR